MPLRGQLAREELTCGSARERANERSQWFVAMIARRASLRSPSRSPIALVSRSDHNAATPSRMNQCGPHECKGQPEGHHVTAKGRRSRGSVKPDSPEGDGAKRSGLTGPRTAGQSRVVMVAVHATLAHVSELARRSRRAGGRKGRRRRSTAAAVRIQSECALTYMNTVSGKNLTGVFSLAKSIEV
jgi:hypothetical protein